MLNIFPVELFCRLTTPYALVYSVKPDSRSWLPIVYIGYLHHKKNVDVTKYVAQYETLAVIFMVWETNLNAVQF